MPKAAPLVFYYVTSHGYGHATRAAAVCSELERLGARVVVRTAAPAWLFSDEGLKAEVRPADLDCGLAMKDALAVDIPASLAAYEALHARWDELRREETALLRREGADVALSDAGALPVEAAAEAGVPAAVVSNFTWDWIVEPWAADEPRWETVRRRMAEAYARADVLLRLPLGGGAPAIVRSADMPLVVRAPSALGREAVRRKLGLDPADSRPVAAYSFGGVDWEGGAAAGADALAGWRFVAYVPRPAGLKADWLQLPRRSPLRHCDIIAAADAVLMKPGYGTFAEVLAARAPALVVPRADFRECAPMLEVVRRLGRIRMLETADFMAGRWQEGLDALAAATDPWADLALDGAEAVARRALALA
ncbi:hypothetical protein EPO15_17630 [bacterium]|nr:MAG: hypothetical protein EPO15_17630 [bacterium]